MSDKALKLRQKALDELELSQKEYDATYDELLATYDNEYKVRDSSFMLLSSVENLINSIKKKPFGFCKNELSRIKKVKQTYPKKEELIRKERKKNLAAGAVAVGAMAGLGAAAAWSYKEFLASFFTGKSLKKKLFIAAIVLVIIIVTIVPFLIWKMFNRKGTAREALKNASKIKKETISLKKDIAKIEGNTKICAELKDVVYSQYETLSKYGGEAYSSIPSDDKIKLASMLNNSQALAELLNKDG